MNVKDHSKARNPHQIVMCGKNEINDKRAEKMQQFISVLTSTVLLEMLLPEPHLIWTSTSILSVCREKIERKQKSNVRKIECTIRHERYRPYRHCLFYMEIRSVRATDYRRWCEICSHRIHKYRFSCHLCYRHHHRLKVSCRGLR